MAQDVAEAVLSYRPDFDGDDLLPWASRAARNRSLNLTRRVRFRAQMPVGLDRAADDFSDAVCSAHASAEQLAALRRELAAMDPDDVALLVAATLGGLDSSDRTRVQRLRARLRTAIGRLAAGLGWARDRLWMGEAVTGWIAAGVAVLVPTAPAAALATGAAPAPSPAVTLTAPSTPVASPAAASQPNRPVSPARAWKTSEAAPSSPDRNALVVAAPGGAPLVRTGSTERPDRTAACVALGPVPETCAAWPEAPPSARRPLS